MRAYKVINCLISQPKHMFWVTYVLGTQKNRLNEGGGGTLSQCSKTLYYKNLLETYFVKTCR